MKIFFVCFLFAFVGVSLHAEEADVLSADTVELASMESLAPPNRALPPSFAEQDTLPKRKRRKARKQSSSPIESEVRYQANDSIVLIGQNVALLYGDAQVNYDNIELKADYIRLRLDSSIVYATGLPDSLGEITGTPVFSEGGESYEAKSMKYNFKSRKGFIWGTVTQQGEGYITSEQTKKIGDDVFCLKNGKYTTCDHHEHPHFYLALTKAKMKTGKYIVSGPAYLVVADVPLPLALPFGYFPINKKYSSGVIFPTLGEEATRGFYARNTGYYFAINDYVDLSLTADIYTKGSWALHMASDYKWRYKFGGAFNISFMQNVFGEKNTPSFSKSNDFRLMWSHKQDQKMTPYTSFSASVNLSTSSYEQNSVSSYYNPDLLSQNTKNSTVTLTQRFPDSPFSLSLSMYATQRTQDSTLSLQLPALSVNMSRIYPFKRKKAVGSDKWYEKIALNYSLNLTNSITAKESEFAETSFLEDWENGIKQSIPISASFSLFKYLNMNISVANNLKWYFRKVDKTWEGDVNGSVVADTTYGFYNIYSGSATLNFQTQLYGFYAIKQKDGKGPIFRHKFVPSVGFSYAPDFGEDMWGYWDSYHRPTSAGGSEQISYDRYAGQVYGGSPSQGSKGMISLQMSNNLEMKYYDKRDTLSDAAKKLMLIDNFSMGTSYNLMADSLNWSNISMNVRFKIASKFTLNINFVLDPYTYQFNAFGNPTRVDVSQIQKNGVLGRIMSTGTSFGYTFNNSTFKSKKKEEEKKKKNSSDQESALGRNMQSIDPLTTFNEKVKAEETVSDYQEFKMPWSLTFNYSVRYAYDDFNSELMEYDRQLTQNLSLSGTLNFTENWYFSVSSYYDITNNEWSYVNCTLARDLHCWQMSCSFVPIGKYKTYNFMIGVKASLLKDLKYEQQSDAYDHVNWY